MQPHSPSASQSLEQTLVWFRSYRCPGATAAGAPWHRRTAICFSTGCWQSVRRGSGARGPGPGTAPPAARSAYLAFWWACAARRWLTGGKPRWFVVSLRCWRASQCFWWPGWRPCCCFLRGLKQKQSFWIIENCQWKDWKLAVTVYEDLKVMVCSLGTWHYLRYVLLYKNLFVKKKNKVPNYIYFFLTAPIWWALNVFSRLRRMYFVV